jgi:tetratricopeptide (TPR) repeat protein
MDGRTFRRALLLGCFLAAGVGCNRQAKHASPVAQLPDTGGTKMVQMPVGGGSKSLWGGSGPAATVPVELAAPVSNKPASAETLVTIADVRLDAAFDERTAPGSKEGLLDMARTGYQKALQQEPKSKAALLGNARYHAKLNEREKAIEMYKKYLTLYPKDADVAHECAVAHARWKDHAGAVAWCEYGLRVDPENRAIKKTLGFCFALVGKWDDAFATLCQIMPEAQARHNLAGLLDHLGQPDASKVQLQLALKADPNFAPAAGFLTELEGGVKPAVAEQPAP